MIFTAICRVFFTSFFTGENIEERFMTSGSDLMSTSATPKKFLYLVMGEKCLPVQMREERNIGNGSTCNCDIIMFGYKEKCHEAKNETLEHVEYIHRNGTTWNTGRNYLYEHAMKRETAYLYYIFMDDDVSMRPNADSNVNVTSLGLGTVHYLWRGVAPKRNVFRGKNFADPTIKKVKNLITQPQISIKK